MFKSRRFCISLVFILLTLCSLNSMAFSFNSILNIFHKKKPVERVVPRRAVDRATHIKVGVYLLHVGKYDMEQATTPMDFYLIFQCKPLCSSFHFEVMNATESTLNLVSKQAGSLIYRVQANLAKTDNLRNFPFDSHALDIIIESKELTRDKLEFTADPDMTAIDNEVGVVGYRLLPYWKAKVTNHYYKVFNKTYSSYKFSIYIARPWLAGFLKGILPALIVVCCSFLALQMRIKHSSQRIGIATSTLITVAVFHLTLTASLPPLGYMTYADMFMLINYLALFAILIEVVLTSYYAESAHEVRAERVNKICGWLLPLVWFILQVLIWIICNPTHINSGN